MQTFATHGLPKSLVSDNGSCFTSDKFCIFMKTNGIHHLTSNPYHAASNRLAERAVQVVKHGLRKIEGGSFQNKLCRVLAHYKITPHSTTGTSPAELLLKGRLCSRLDILLPDILSSVLQVHSRQKLHHDKLAKSRALSAGTSVFTVNFGPGPKWLSGVIKEITGPVSALMQIPDGHLLRRHFDQICVRNSSEEEAGVVNNDLPVENDVIVISSFTSSVVDKTGSVSTSGSVVGSGSKPSSMEPRRSKRTVKPDRVIVSM